MNRHEIEEELKVLRQRRDVINNDLKKFAVELSAASQVAMIARLAQTEAVFKEYESMLDFINFDDIVKGQFNEMD